MGEMNRDARGREIAIADSVPSSKGTTPDRKLEQRAKRGKVTSKIKGQTNVFVKLAALQGKGYPAPVALDDGRVTPNIHYRHRHVHHRKHRRRR